jgi:predicted negative regulator of RcsB-dependent stress response
VIALQVFCQLLEPVFLVFIIFSFGVWMGYRHYQKEQSSISKCVNEFKASAGNDFKKNEKLIYMACKAANEE